MAADCLMLDTKSQVLEYLCGQDFASSKYELGNPTNIEEIEGGTTNFVYRLEYLANRSRDDVSQVQNQNRRIPSAVLKFAAEYATNDPGTPFPSTRQMYEVRAMEQLALALTAHGGKKSSLVRIPELYHFDEQAHVIIMEDVTPKAPTLTSELPAIFVSLEKMCQQPVGANAFEIIDQVGGELGSFLFHLHHTTRLGSDPSSDTLRQLFITNEVSKEIDVQTCFRDVPRKLEEFHITLEDDEKARLGSVTAEMVADYLERPESVIMGDFWFGNIFLKLSGNGDRKTLEEITIIDWEFVTCAPSYVDLAHLLSEIWLQNRFFPEPPAAARVNRQLAISTFKSYLALGGEIDHRRIVNYVAAHACCFLDFMDWNNKDGLKQTVARQGATMMLQVDAGEWEKLFENDSFMEVLLQLEASETSMGSD